MPSLDREATSRIYGAFLQCVEDEEKALSIDFQDHYVYLDDEMDDYSSFEEAFDDAHHFAYDYLEERGFDEDDLEEASRAINVIAAIALVDKAALLLDIPDDEGEDPGGFDRG